MEKEVDKMEQVLAIFAECQKAFLDGVKENENRGGLEHETTIEEANNAHVECQRKLEEKNKETRECNRLCREYVAKAWIWNSKHDYLLTERKKSREQAETLLSNCQNELETQKNEVAENKSLSLLYMGKAMMWEQRHDYLLTKVRSIKSDLPPGEGDRQSLFGFAFITLEFLLMLLVLAIFLDFIGTILLEIPGFESRFGSGAASCSMGSAFLNMILIAFSNREWNMKLCGLEFSCATLRFILCIVIFVRSAKGLDVWQTIRLGALIVSFVLNLTSAFKGYFEDKQLLEKVDKILKYEDGMVERIKSL